MPCQKTLSSSSNKDLQSPLVKMLCTFTYIVQEVYYRFLCYFPSWKVFLENTVVALMYFEFHSKVFSKGKLVDGEELVQYIWNVIIHISKQKQNATPKHGLTPFLDSVSTHVCWTFCVAGAVQALYLGQSLNSDKL